MASETSLSTISIVWCIAAGALICILIGLFSKRQITRFTLKSARRPHVSIGSDAPKELRQEIQRRLERVGQIKYEPVLLTEKTQQAATTGPIQYYYRMKAIDAFGRFGDMLRTEVPGSKVRHPSQPLRHYLLTLYPTFLSSSTTDLIHQFADVYEQARHDPSEFGESHYNLFIGLLEELLTCLKVGIKNRNNSAAALESVQVMDTEVVFEPGSKISEPGQAKTLIQESNSVVKEKNDSIKKTSTKDSGAGSGQSSIVESGISSQRSSIECVTPSDPQCADRQALISTGSPNKGQYV